MIYASEAHFAQSAIAGVRREIAATRILDRRLVATMMEVGLARLVRFTSDQVIGHVSIYMVVDVILQNDHSYTADARIELDVVAANHQVLREAISSLVIDTEAATFDENHVELVIRRVHILDEID